MANLYDISGKVSGKVELPAVFQTQYRPDLIQRAVVAKQSENRQPYANAAYAGLQSSADYFGNRHHSYRLTINRGQSRLPREKPGGGGLGKVRKVPQSVGGRRAHPPKNKEYSKKINQKEEQAALSSAIASTADLELVKSRGHTLHDDTQVPIILEDKFQEISKTKQALQTLTALGLDEELTRATQKSIRAGRGTTRGRKYKQKKSALIIIAQDKGLKKALQNVPGLDVVTPKDLTVEDLAPGTHAGRLTIYTKSALEELTK